ncbi:Mobile element protein [Streptococcus agalactiae ILRI005]|nr:Mobile element protein [Streptococcus agalactiae ILRI005]CCW40146.1 Mobile element protein [Streptococcus agalactiae ILRI005]
MCRWLKIPRSSYYYKAVKPVPEAELGEKIKSIFLQSKSRYGARKIKKMSGSTRNQLVSPSDSSHHEEIEFGFCLPEGYLQTAF